MISAEKQVPLSPRPLFRVARKTIRTVERLRQLSAKRAARMTGVIVMLGAALIFLYNLFSDQVFVNDVRIGTAIEGRGGFSGATLLEEALARMEPVARERTRRLSFSTQQFQQLTERRSARWETSVDCMDVLTIVRTDPSLYLGERGRAVMSSRTLDAVVTGESFSLKKLAFVLRGILDQRARELTPFLHMEGNRFVLTVRESPVVITAEDRKRRSFERLEEAPRALADLLLDFLSPELVVAEKFDLGQRDIEHEWLLSRKFLRSRQKSLLIRVAAVGKAIDDVKHGAENGFAHFYHERSLKALSVSLDFSQFGRFSSLVQAALASHVERAEDLKLSREGRSASPGLFYQMYVAPFAGRLSTSIEGRIALAQYDVSHGRTAAFLSGAREILDLDLMISTRGLVSNAEAQVLFIALALQFGQFDAADELARVDSEGAISRGSQELYLVEAYRAVLSARKGDTAALERLSETAFGGSVCAENAATRQLLQLTNQGRLAPEAMARLRPLLLKSFARLEAAGLKGYGFYDAWAGLLGAEDAPGSIEKWDTARRFDGEHAWALLNSGAAALQIGDAGSARDRFLRSLAVKPVAAAVEGLLISLYITGDDPEFVKALFDYAAAILRAFKHDVRGKLEGLAAVVGCRLDRDDLPSLLLDGEPILVDGVARLLSDLNRETCTFPQKAP